MADLATYRRRLADKASEHDHAARTVRAERRELRTAKANARAARKAQALVVAVAEKVQSRAHARIAQVVSRGLKAVFGDDAYDLVIRFVRRRGRTDAEFRFARGGLEVEPCEAAGGGVVDVAAFCLRLVCLMLAVPRRRRLLVLDEPFKHLSADFRPAVRALIEMLAKECEMQVVMVTHSRELVCGKTVVIE